MEVKLILHELTAYTFIGIRDEEQKSKQCLHVNLEIIEDVKISKDALVNVIDYSTLSKAVTGYLENNKFALLETAAIGIAHILDNTPMVKRYKVRVTKGGASIEVESH